MPLSSACVVVFGKNILVIVETESDLPILIPKKFLIVRSKGNFRKKKY